jgi:cysteine desulfurase/selenocysteine lyase
VKTKLVAVTAVSNAIGTHVDLAPLIARAKVVGARVLVDAAQLVSHNKVNVAQLDCDFLVFSGHKMLAPTGIGVLFIKKELHAQMEPYEVGGGIVEYVELENPSFIETLLTKQEKYTERKKSKERVLDIIDMIDGGEPEVHATDADKEKKQSSECFIESSWVQAPQKFEAGTPPIAQAIGLGAAIDYLSSVVDFDALQQYEADLCSRLIDGLAQIKQVKILGPQEQLRHNGHMVSFVVEGIHAHDVAAFLDTKGIAVRAGHHCAQPLAHKLGYESSVRASFYLYNTSAEVDQLIEAIAELVKDVTITV